MNKDVYSRYLQGQIPKKVVEEVSVNTTAFDGNQFKEELEKLKKSIDDHITVTRQNENFVNQVDLVIENGRVVVPDQGIFQTDITIDDGKIISLGRSEAVNARERIDAGGQYIIPGVIDPHVHLGIYQSFDREIISETRAALAGGVTTVGCFLGSNSSHFSTFPEFERKINSNSRVDVIPHLVISTESQKEEVEEYVKYFGVSSFKIYISGIKGLIPDVEDDFIMDMLEKLKSISDNCVLCVHAENKRLINRSSEKARSKYGESLTLSQWREAHADYAEEEACRRMAYFAKLVQMQVYLVHISTARAMKAMIDEKKDNPYITIETTSPYLTTNTTNENGHLAKMIPPVGNPEDQDMLWEGIITDTVDTIGTDNVSITKAAKSQESFWDKLPGYSVLETHLPSLLSEGVNKRGIALEKLISKLTKNPAQKFNIYPQKGTIQVGSDADLVIIDLNMKKDIANQAMESLTDFSIHDGTVLKGWPLMTIKGGVIVAKDGRVINDVKRGKCIKTM